MVNRLGKKCSPEAALRISARSIKQELTWKDVLPFLFVRKAKKGGKVGGMDVILHDEKTNEI